MLNPNLQQIVNGVGNTPIKEPELALIFNELSISSVEKVAKHILKDDVKKYTPAELTDFFMAVKTRVMAFKDEKGVSKVTPNTQNYTRLNFEQLEEIHQFAKNEDYISVETKILEYTKLDITKVTDWEKGLVISSELDTLTNILNTVSGKRFES